MQKEIRASPEEIALGKDVNDLQSFIGNDLARIFYGLLTNDLTLLGRSGVIAGFGVAIASPFANYIISPGVAIQSKAVPIDPTDYTAELMFTEGNTNLAVVPPPAVGTRVDIIEMRSQARTVENQTRDFVDLTTGQRYPRSTQKIVRSIPEFRIRPGVTGAAIFDLEWIPIALVTCSLPGGIPTFVFTDVRPMYRQKTGTSYAAGYFNGEIASPDTDLTLPSNGGQLAMMFGGFVHFDGRDWPMPTIATRTITLLGNGVTVGLAPPEQLFHLYIAKPDMVTYSPDVVQYIVTTIAPDPTGRPLFGLLMRPPLTSFPTLNAMHLCSFIVIPFLDGFGVVQPRSTGFRKAGNFTAIGERDNILKATVATIIPSSQLAISLPFVPPTASHVRMAIAPINDVGYNFVTEIGAATNLNGLLGIPVNYMKWQVQVAGAGRFTVVQDLPLMRAVGGAPPSVLLVGDAPFKIEYRILGWIETPSSAITPRG